MTPDFVEFLLQTPEAQRRGRVFRLNQDGGTVPLDTHHVGQVVTKIGRKSGVVVATVEKRKQVDGKLVAATVKKCASIHDLRRTFGSRWARKVMPAVLQRLMRHANVQTTMQYYVDLDADALADALWADHRAIPGVVSVSSNISSNITAESADAVGSPVALTPITEIPC